MSSLTVVTVRTERCILYPCLSLSELLQVIPALSALLLLCQQFPKWECAREQISSSGGRVSYCNGCSVRPELCGVCGSSCERAGPLWRGMLLSWDRVRGIPRAVFGLSLGTTLITHRWFSCCLP